MTRDVRKLRSVPTKGVTIRDVARLAGVSESTVSRVLTEAQTAVSISQETRQRVATAAAELNYHPHPLARALRGKGTNLLGVIVREIDDPFFAELIEVIGNVARERGYDLVLGYAKSDPEKALALGEILDLRHNDGLFLLGDLRESPEDHTFLARMARDRRMVSVCRGSQGLVNSTSSVAVDNRKGTFMALDYLHRLGHEKIAFINAGRVGDLLERVEAFCEFMRVRFGRACEEYVAVDSNSFEGGYRAAKRLLALPSPPTAILAADDTMAIGALSAAADVGRVVPRDVSIIGFDDIKIAAFLRPALTTVRQPVEQIGREAVALLVEQIRKDSAPDPLPRVLIEPELIVRDSCAPPQTGTAQSALP